MDLKVLVFDDAYFARVLIKDALIKNGIADAVVASDKEEALRLYDDILPKIAVVGLSVSNSNGMEVLSGLLNKNPDMKIIVCTAEGYDLIVAEAFERGATAFLPKPVDERKLCGIVTYYAQAEDKE